LIGGNLGGSGHGGSKSGKSAILTASRLLSADCHGQPEKTAKIEIAISTTNKPFHRMTLNFFMQNAPKHPYVIAAKHIAQALWIYLFDVTRCKPASQDITT
jgi:hypothetical protein